MRGFAGEIEDEELPEDFARVGESGGFVVPPAVGIFVVDEEGESRPVAVGCGLEEMFGVFEDLAFGLPEPEKKEDENDGGMTSTTQIELMYANRTD